MAPRKKTVTTTTTIFVINCDVCGKEGAVTEDSEVTTCEPCRRARRLAVAQKFLDERMIGATIKSIEAYNGNNIIESLVVVNKAGMHFRLFPESGRIHWA